MDNPTCTEHTTYIRPTASPGKELCVDGTWYPISDALSYASCYLLKVGDPTAIDGYYEIKGPGGQSVTYCLGMDDDDGPWTRVYDIHDYHVPKTENFMMTVDDLGMSYNKFYFEDRGNTLWDWFCALANWWKSQGISTYYITLKISDIYYFFSPIYNNFGITPNVEIPRSELYNTTDVRLSGKNCKNGNVQQADACFSQFKMHSPVENPVLQLIADAETLGNNVGNNVFTHDIYAYVASCDPPCSKCLARSVCLACTSPFKFCPSTSTPGAIGSCINSCDDCLIDGVKTSEYTSGLCGSKYIYLYIYIYI